MHRTSLFPGCFSFVTLAVSLAAQSPEWIWSSGTPGESDVRFFRKEFRITEAPEKATLQFACDNKATVFLDGRSIGESSEWSEPAVVDVTKRLDSGDHLLAVRAENQGGAAGLLVKLDVAFPATKKLTLATDASWQVADRGERGWNQPDAPAQGFAAATSLGKLGMQPWGNILAGGAVRAPRKSGEAPLPEALQVADGFQVERLRSAQAGEGSWVSMTIDPKGRFIVSPQGREPMLRFTIANGKIAKQEIIDLPVSGAMGLLCAFDSLYVNGQGPDGYHLYRLRDTDGDDQYDKWELIRKWGGGSGEHGAHGIVLGPDSKLYVVCGNFVDVPADRLRTSPHQHYADDLVLPRMEDGNGFGAGKKPPGGYVVRLDRDGKNAELFASGQRNTYDIAFNADGELFGFDSDMEWDWGTPWYRPIRVFHAVSGGDSGFREGTGKWPEYFPDSLPPVMNVGIGSPTGVKFGTDAKYPPKYRRAFYAMDWSYGRILAAHLTPDGAGYRGTFENFVAPASLTGPGPKTPLNVTDLEFGADGAMYFTIGGRGTVGGLYRVSYTRELEREKTPPDSAAVAARALRHRLETFHGKADPAALDVAWPQLDSPDRYLRYAARIAVESQPVDEWQKRALEEPRKRASLTALLALARLGSRESQDDLFEALGRHWPDELDENEKVEALRVSEVCISRMGRPSESTGADIIKSLQPLYPSKSWRLNRELSQLLIALEAPGVVKTTLDLRDAAATQEEQVHYMVALRNVKSGWSLDERRRYFAWFRDRSKTPDGGPNNVLGRNTRHADETVQWFKDAGRDYGDGASFGNFLKNLRKAAVETLADNEKGELAPLLVDAQVAAARQPRKERKLVREWKTADLVADLDAAGKGRNFENGREAFAAAQCLACHRFGNEGGPNGPDITAISSRFSRKDILESILEPSKVVSEQYQNITVFKKDGDDVTGRLVEETDSKLVLVPNQLTGEKVEVKKSDVQSRAASKLSPMPEGLANSLTKEELLDLIAYIESGGRKSHAAFRGD